MPQVKVSQLIGKTFYPRYTVRYYDVFDINNEGDNAKKAGVLQKNDSFVMDSFLMPVESYTNKYGIKYAKRSSLFFTFKKGNKYYGIKYDPNLYSLSKLQEQGTQTTQQEEAAQIEENKTPLDKIEDIFKSGAGLVKNLIYIGVAIFAVGYLIPKFEKK